MSDTVKAAIRLLKKPEPTKEIPDLAKDIQHFLDSEDGKDALELLGLKKTRVSFERRGLTEFVIDEQGPACLLHPDPGLTGGGSKKPSRKEITTEDLVREVKDPHRIILLLTIYSERLAEQTLGIHP